MSGCQRGPRGPSMPNRRSDTRSGAWRAAPWLAFLVAMSGSLAGCLARAAGPGMAQPAAAPVGPPRTGVSEMRYLALGDSYTIGERVGEAERWPARIAALLRERRIAVADPEIVARTGWTTDELAAGLDRAAPRGPFDLVSLLIGVNDQYRGRGPEEYRARFRALLQRAAGLAGGDPGRVIVLSIPDWGATPFAAGRDRGRIAAEIDRFNAANLEETEHAGARYVDVTAASRAAAGDREAFAPDGLHPSGSQYAAWARLALPAALQALSGSPGPG